MPLMPYNKSLKGPYTKYLEKVYLEKVLEKMKNIDGSVV